MTSRASDSEATCLDVLEGALSAGEAPDLAGWTAPVVDRALQALVRRHGAGAAPLLRAIAQHSSAKDIRKTARLAIYRLEQSGIAVPRADDRSPTQPVVKLEAERPVRAWLSGIDGTGSRAVWLLFEGGLGGRLSLCSLIVNDEAGILEAAGGAITRKRLDAELRALREHQKLPWVETDPARARALVEHALGLHERAGTEPPGEFSRWRRLFTPSSAEPVSTGPRESPADVDPSLLDRTGELLDLPELLGWFVDPASLHEDAVALLQARESRLVVADHIKAEREAAIVDAVVEKQFTPDARRRWANRLRDMAFIFRATHRDEPARLAECAAVALADEERALRTIPLVHGLALRGLTIGTEVALGRVKLSEVSRAPARPPRLASRS